MKNGIELIADERKEQIEKHGRTVERDAQENDKLQLAKGAGALLFPNIISFPSGWDYNIVSRMARKDYISRLTIAGALIAAEIDRLNFIETKE